MSQEQNKWNLDRAPTFRERVFSIVVSGFLSILFGGLVLMFAQMLIFEEAYRTQKNIIFLAGLSIAMAISIIVLYRSCSKESRKPSAVAQIITGYIIVIMSVVMLVLTFVVDGNTYYLLALSFTGMPLGLKTINQGKRLRNA